MLVHPRLMCPRPKILGCCIPWTKCPLAILPLTEPSHPFDLIERIDTRLQTATHFSAAKRWSSMCGLSVHPTEGRQSNKPGQGRRRSRPDAPLIHQTPEADGATSMLDVVQGRDTSVRDTISKERFVQVAQHPRIFGWGHIGRGHINIRLSHWELTVRADTSQRPKEKNLLGQYQYFQITQPGSITVTPLYRYIL